MHKRTKQFFLVIVGLLLASLLTLPSRASMESQAPSCGEQPAESLIVFVGRRIEIRPAGVAVPPRQPLLVDAKFMVTYDVLHVLCGPSPLSRIEFEVYDHYGTPAFAEFETVLLYVSRDDGRWLHLKYLYNPVYEVEDGTWAGCGDPYAHEPEVDRGTLRTTPARFKNEVSFSVLNLTDEQIGEQYPREYFTRRGDLAICTAGASINDLFAIKRSGVLRARGLFP